MEYTRRSKYENQVIHTRFKNRRHTKSTIKKRSSNSLKQNGKFNLQLFNRLYSYKVNQQYSLSKYLKLNGIYNDYDMILYDNYKDCNYCEHDGYPININQWRNTTKINIKKKKSQKRIRKSININTNPPKNISKISIKISRKSVNISSNKPIKSSSNNNEIKANKLYNMYEKMYFAKNKTKDAIIPIITDMMSFVSKKDIKTEEKSENNNSECKVCYCDTKNDDTLELVSMIKYCSHCMICQDCFIQHLKITIKDNENILPWLLCPAQNCKAVIHKDLLLKYININDLYRFACSFIYKHLQRNEYWINCDNCKFGWIVVNKNKCILKCKDCGNNYKRKDENNNGFKELIENGIMKECPECNYPAMKDYGMCNVMHCGKCGIYWNWRTKDVGSSSNEVKQKARRNGTLWESGELAYQQNLERNNLKEFVALLSRNGIKYDPNYRRGS